MESFSTKSKKINPDTYRIPLGLTPISDIMLQEMLQDIASSHFLRSYDTGNIQKSGKAPVF